MAVTGFFHHVGTFLLFAATVLLIITDITSPVVNSISMMRVDLGNATASHHSAVTFGTFGHCILDTAAGRDFCTPSEVGYNPAAYMSQVEGTEFSRYATDTTRILTRVMILHPIATGLCFLAFALALGAGVVGSFLAALVALLAFLVTLVVLVTDFVLFSVVRSNVGDDGTGSRASYGAGMWTLLVAAICALLGTIVVFFTCCSARLHRRRRGAAPASTKMDGYAASPPRRRRWF